MATGTRARDHGRAVPVAEGLAGQGMSTLHRHVLALAFTRWAMVLFIGLFLILVGDFISQMGRYVEALGAGRGLHVLQYNALRFPTFLAIWLPVSAAAAALLAAWPMLRQGTLVALCAAGIPVRRVFASLVVMALGIGALGFLLQDQAIPRLEPEAKLAKARMVGSLQFNESAARTVAWHDGGHFWCAASARPEDGDYRQVAVFDARPTHGTMLMADRLLWRDGGWYVERPVLVLDDITPVLVKEQCRIEDVGLTLAVDAATLVERLMQDRNRTSDQLFAVGSENAWGYLMLRICFGLLPLLCMVFALPGFLRLEGRNNLGSALGRSLLWALVPMVGYWLLSRILVSNSTYVISGTAVVLGSLLAGGTWRWWTMRL
jgi:lipopolysaccharide export LptBFGC system permease protein LptF